MPIATDIEHYLETDELLTDGAIQTDLGYQLVSLRNALTALRDRDDLRVEDKRNKVFVRAIGGVWL